MIWQGRGQTEVATGVGVLPESECRAFCEICEDRGHLNSRLSVSPSQEQLRDSTLVNGILDALVRNGRCIEMHGDSMGRNRESRMCNFRVARYPSRKH